MKEADSKRAIEVAEIVATALNNAPGRFHIDELIGGMLEVIHQIIDRIPCAGCRAEKHINIANIFVEQYGVHLEGLGGGHIGDAHVTAQGTTAEDADETGVPN